MTESVPGEGSMCVRNRTHADVLHV